MVIRTVLIVIVAAFVISCQQDEQMKSTSDQQGSEGLRAADYERARQDKDDFFRNAPDSPLPEEVRAQFKGLSYFAPSAEFVVKARLIRSADAPTFKMPTTQNDLRDAFQYGVFEFTVRGQALRLPAYRFTQAQHPYLFVPFTDSTTGNETYATGRYLDIEMQESDQYVIDFNDAYNPYCAYNDKYSCPLVPKENHLPIAIEAGEKTWEH